MHTTALVQLPGQPILLRSKLIGIHFLAATLIIVNMKLILPQHVDCRNGGRFQQSECLRRDRGEHSHGNCRGSGERDDSVRPCLLETERRLVLQRLNLPATVGKLNRGWRAIPFNREFLPPQVLPTPYCLSIRRTRPSGSPPAWLHSSPQPRP